MNNIDYFVCVNLFDIMVLLFIERLWIIYFFNYNNFYENLIVVGVIICRRVMRNKINILILKNMLKLRFNFGWIILIENCLYLILFMYLCNLVK